MTQEQAVAICSYVADNFIAPLAYSKAIGYEIWETMSTETYNNFVEMINSMLDN